MKYIFLLPLILFSCNSKKELESQKLKHEKLLIEKDEKIKNQNEAIDFMKKELRTCNEIKKTWINHGIQPYHHRNK